MPLILVGLGLYLVFKKKDTKTKVPTSSDPQQGDPGGVNGLRRRSFIPQHYNA
ncbi:MAG TPA: hypothetical protein PKD57_07780 [Saprospiraceae bacterium]|nr:hypothetical protein [Saprospiraceae bacterium]